MFDDGLTRSTKNGRIPAIAISVPDLMAGRARALARALMHFQKAAAPQGCVIGPQGCKKAQSWTLPYND
jgi:hypothetical protein